jgi:hypothetical protein
MKRRAKRGKDSEQLRTQAVLIPLSTLLSQSTEENRLGLQSDALRMKAINVIPTCGLSLGISFISCIGAEFM